MKTIPPTFTIGKEYFNDTEFIECQIICHAFTPAIIKDFTFKIGIQQVEVSFDKWISIKITQQLSKKLFNDLPRDNSSYFIIGYINRLLPTLNNYLLKQKYSQGHLLLRTYSTLDLLEIIVKNLQTNKEVHIQWPMIMPSFPPTINSLKNFDCPLYIKDVIDLISSYFSYNYDDCVRKAITSLENYFILIKCKGNTGNFFQKIRNFLCWNICGLTTPFRDKVNACINREVIKENIYFIYKTRNKIVHHKHRLNPSHDWFCKKVIGTLLNAYKFSLPDCPERKLLFSIEHQFVILDDIFRGFDLDKLKNSHLTNYKSKIKVINNDEDLDNFVMNGLKITNKEQKIILP
ncbi:MAG TPA: hypothetical protein VI564_01465 [Candidatus Nanoarchaeia archaeon]|nr:hypothetical protein [Candidatus Nanoarchaeia archaeon]